MRPTRFCSSCRQQRRDTLIARRRDRRRVRVQHRAPGRRRDGVLRRVVHDHGPRRSRRRGALEVSGSSRSQRAARRSATRSTAIRAAPPLLLINSIGSTREMWARQMPALHECLSRHPLRRARPRRLVCSAWTVHCSINSARDALAILDDVGVGGRACLRDFARRHHRSVAGTERAGSCRRAWCSPTPPRESARWSRGPSGSISCIRKACRRSPTWRWSAGSRRRSTNAIRKPSARSGRWCRTARRTAISAAAPRCAMRTCATRFRASPPRRCSSPRSADTATPPEGLDVHP